MDCAKEIITTNREAERSERDLEAQQTMARWTWVMGAVAGAGLLISLIGVILVYITFRETRRAADAGFEANKIAQESSERQLRAYLKIRGLRIENIKKNAVPTVMIGVENVGQTPAIKVYSMAVTTYVAAPRAKVLDVPDSVIDGRGKDTPDLKHWGNLMPKASTLIPLQLDVALNEAFWSIYEAGNGLIFVRGTLHYTDVFEQERWLRFQAFNDIECEDGATINIGASEYT